MTTRQVVSAATGLVQTVSLSPAELTARTQEATRWEAVKAARASDDALRALRQAAVDALLEELLAARALQANPPKAVTDYAGAKR